MRGHYKIMADIRQVADVPMVFGKDCNDISEIIEVYDTRAFVYVLIKNKKPIYIGQSEQAWTRIYSHGHSTRGVSFSCFLLIPCEDASRRRLLESKLISALNPPLNTLHRSNAPKRRYAKRLKAYADDHSVYYKRLS